jgi:hypothetical protein
VTGSLRNHTALIVEEDVGFLLWLGQLLTEAGYRTIPASDSRQAAAFVHEIGVPIHLAVVNFNLKGASSMLRALGATHRDLRIIAIGHPGKENPARVPASAILEKPRSSERVSHEDWQQRIHQAVTDAPPLDLTAVANRSS